jgi:hypothetical protein
MSTLPKHPFVNTAELYEYKVSANDQGINLTGGNIDTDGPDILFEELGMTREQYKAFIPTLPLIIRGSSGASPKSLAKAFCIKTATAVQANEGKLPRGLEPEFHQRLKTLGIKIPVQGKPQYNPKK